MNRESSPSFRGQTIRCQWLGMRQYANNRVCVRSTPSAQDPLERLVVRVVIEDAQPRIGPIEHVIHVTALSGSMRSSHSAIVSRRRSPEKVPDTFSSFAVYRPSAALFKVSFGCLPLARMTA